MKTVDLLGCGSPPPLLTVRKRTAVGCLQMTRRPGTAITFALDATTVLRVLSQSLVFIRLRRPAGEPHRVSSDLAYRDRSIFEVGHTPSTGRYSSEGELQGYHRNSAWMSSEEAGSQQAVTGGSVCHSWVLRSRTAYRTRGQHSHCRDQ